MKKRALIIGIDKYSDDIQSLNSCTNDATEIDGLLQMPEYGYETLTLINEEASRSRIMQNLSHVFNNETDIALLYFAGHGAIDDIGTLWLVTSDGNRIELGIDFDIIKKSSRRMKKEAICIIILDCCHAGQAKISSINSGNAFLAARNDDLRNVDFGSSNGKVLLAASLANEYAKEETSLNHGVFTYYLLQAMYGEAADDQGDISINAIYEVISTNFERVFDQTPVFRGDIAGRIVIGNGITPTNKKWLPREKRIETIQMAIDLLNEYVRLETTDIEKWKNGIYKECSDKLTVLIMWFEKKMLQNQELENDAEFKVIYDTLQDKLARLGFIQPGYLLKQGKVKSKLGTGTFGVVWQIETEEGYDAYKIYHADSLDDKDKRSRFVRGYNAMQQLDHPNIVKVKSLTNAPYGFIMDYIEGGNLRNFNIVDLSAAQRILILLKIGETIQHAHSRGVIHRDVKPENIIIKEDINGTEEPSPFLTDFDLSWFSTATQLTREGIGSLIYAAPEQLHKPNASVTRDKTTDVYSFGQIMFYIFCERDPVPLLANNSRALEQKLEKWIAKEPAEILMKLYIGCTDNAPEKRYSDFRKICDSLFDVYNLLTKVNHKTLMSIEGFAKELIYSIIGLSSEHLIDEMSFYTISKQTKITIECKECNDEKYGNINIIFESINLPLVSGASFKDAKKIINRRIDNMLSQYQGFSRKAVDIAKAYSMKLEALKIELNIDGVEKIRPVIMRAFEIIETA